MNNGGISDEARAFIEAAPSADVPTDFTRMAEVREEVRQSFAAGAERAVARFALQREDVVVGGVNCERVTSGIGGSDAGTLLYLFGGGFIVGCPESDLPIIGALAAHCGVEVIAPKYRLAPEHPAPAAADDCLAAWRALTAERTGPLALAGESAGGNLAMVVAQRAQAEGLALPVAMALLSPAVDLRTDEALFAPTLHADPTLHPNRVREVQRAYARDGDPLDPALSPLFGRLDGLPPTVITTGTRDLLLAMCLRLHRGLLRAGVAAECRVWDGLWHVFEYYDEIPEAAESLEEIARFLRRHLEAPAGR